MTDTTDAFQIARNIIDHLYDQISKHASESDFDTTEHIQKLDMLEPMLLTAQHNVPKHSNYQCNDILKTIGLARIQMPRSDFTYGQVRLFRAQTTVGIVGTKIAQYYFTEPQHEEAMKEILPLIEKAHKYLDPNGTAEIDTLRCYKCLDEVTERLLKL